MAAEIMENHIPEIAQAFASKKDAAVVLITAYTYKDEIMFHAGTRESPAYEAIVKVEEMRPDKFVIPVVVQVFVNEVHALITPGFVVPRV